MIAVVLRQTPGQRGCGAPCRVFGGVRRSGWLLALADRLRSPPHSSDRSAALRCRRCFCRFPPTIRRLDGGSSPEPSRSNLSRSVSSKEILRSEWRIFSTTPLHPPHPPTPSTHHHSLTTPPSPLHEDTESPAPVRPPQSLSLFLGSSNLRVFLACCRSCRETRTGEPHRDATLFGRSEQKSNSFIMEVCVLRGGAHGQIAGPAA